MLFAVNPRVSPRYLQAIGAFYTKKKPHEMPHDAAQCVLRDTARGIELAQDQYRCRGIHMHTRLRIHTGLRRSHWHQSRGGEICEVILSQILIQREVSRE